MLRRIVCVALPIFPFVVACSGSSGSPIEVGGSGGNVAQSGGAGTQSGGAGTQSGGAGTQSGGSGSQSGGANAQGGAPSSGGSNSQGGAQPIGGNATETGGSSGVGGSATTGGSNNQGGASLGGNNNRGGAQTGGKAAGGSSQGGAATGGKATGGAVNQGGASVGGGGGAPTGTGGAATGTGGAPGSCENGSTTTTWASNCPTTAPTCTTGTWIDGGVEPTNVQYNLTKLGESEHFVVYGDSSATATTATNATTYLENTVWKTMFGSPMFMKEPLCSSSTKYKCVIHVRSAYGITGGSWNGNRMGLWIGPGTLNDHWGLAHEFTHSVQGVDGGQSCGGATNTCGWVSESHANFVPHQMTEYRGDVHCSEMLVNATHLYLGSTRDRYCNWQFMEYLKDKYCHSAVDAIWSGAKADNPFTAIRNFMNWSVSQLNDFMGEWAMHNITWDYQNPPPTSGGNQSATYRSKYGSITDTSQHIRRLRLTKVEPLNSSYATDRRFVSPFYWAPQRYGYNVIRLYPESSATSVTVTFRGVTSSASSPDWRWGLVATDSGITTARYSPAQKGSDGSLTFCVKSGEPLFLVVMGTPSAWYNIVWDQPYNTVPRYPYMFELAGAWPDGFQNGQQDACPTGLTRASNGGGCAPSGTSVYVGPYATVLSGATVSGSARIEDHAIVARGSVTGGTVGAMTIIGSNQYTFTMSSGTAKTTFYPLGFFESGQGLSGGTLIGDVEYRNAGLNRASGTCSGFVDPSTCVAPGTDATPVPPYTWR